MRMSKFTVRTSERRVFRRCLRKWGFQSSKRQNLQGKGTETNIHFWFGSAIHFAMEDYFGYNKFGDVQRAFQAYYAAFPPHERPEGADTHYHLGMSMLEYFKVWYARHNQDMQFVTVWLAENKQEVEPGTPGAHPLIEESFLLDLGIKAWVNVETEEILKITDADVTEIFSDGGSTFFYTKTVQVGVDAFDFPIEEEVTIEVAKVPVCYHGTMDRIVKDKHGRWWILDYKTAKSADTGKLDTDDQISAYLWAAEQWFGKPFYGFVYLQLTKDMVQEPKRLANGQLSVDKKQKTTSAKLKETLIKEFGSMSKVPKKYMDFYNHITAQETPEGDRFIRWDYVTRNKAQKESTFRHILGEVNMMVDPDLYLFPNPTRDCVWDCPFRDVCIKMDDGNEEEAQQILDFNFEQRPRTQDGNIEPWRENVPWPEKHGEAVGTMIEAAIPGPEVTLNLILPDKYKDLDL